MLSLFNGLWLSLLDKHVDRRLDWSLDGWLNSMFAGVDDSLIEDKNSDLVLDSPDGLKLGLFGSSIKD